METIDCALIVMQLDDVIENMHCLWNISYIW